MIKKKILFIDFSQYGYLTDTLKYCEYLKDCYDITYLCFDKKLKKIKTEGVRVLYINYHHNKLLRNFLFLSYAFYTIVRFDGFIFVEWFNGFQILKMLCPWKKMHLDIRSLSVVANDNIRQKKDEQLKKIINYFDSVSIISEGVRNRLSVSDSKPSYILPLGADSFSTKKKNFDILNLLYVGTLTNRKVVQTLQGLKIFLDSHNGVEIYYDIVGDGEDAKELESFIKKNKMEHIVKMWGRVVYRELGPFFERCNVGVSYVPITDYFQYQPPTKTFEYAFAGMPTIATATEANKEIINEHNGLLIGDNPIEFARALNVLLRMKEKYDSEIIRASVERYSWRTIVEEKLVQIIEKEYPRDKSVL